MRTIDIKFLTIEDAARRLVESAPARGDFWGITMRARFSTTRPADIIAQYRRIVQRRAWAYESMLPPAQKARIVCNNCGASGCKMWREYNTFANHTEILCGLCALNDQGKEGPIDADGKIGSEFGKCDQIGWLVPAVPDLEGLGFWGYTSVPAEACEWWRLLPSYPSNTNRRAGASAEEPGGLRG